MLVPDGIPLYPLPSRWKSVFHIRRPLFLHGIAVYVFCVVTYSWTICCQLRFSLWCSFPADVWFSGLLFASDFRLSHYVFHASDPFSANLLVRRFSIFPTCSICRPIHHFPGSSLINLSPATLVYVLSAITFSRLATPYPSWLPSYCPSSAIRHTDIPFYAWFSSFLSHFLNLRMLGFGIFKSYTVCSDRI